MVDWLFSYAFLNLMDSSCEKIKPGFILIKALKTKIMKLGYFTNRDMFSFLPQTRNLVFLPSSLGIHLHKTRIHEIWFFYGLNTYLSLALHDIEGTRILEIILSLILRDDQKNVGIRYRVAQSEVNIC